MGGGYHRNDGLDLAILVQLQVGERVQLGIDEAPDHHGDDEVSTKTPTPFTRVAMRPPDFLGGAGVAVVG